MKLAATLVLVIAFGAATAVATAAEARTYGGHYTQERLANARRNCDTYPWAKALRDKAVAAAAPWAAKSDEDLWAMVPGQDLPRTIDVTMDTRATGGAKRVGCLVCGDKIFAHGNYPYEPDIEHKPWKLTCPSCGAVFPTNDFGKYYASGIDEHGLFNPGKADRSLLYNVDHPDPKDPLHTFGVDDGFGYVDKEGHAHKFIGYYTWKYWRYLYEGYHALANAFVYTGDKKYAHKCAVLLDRLADVYPAMDWNPYAERGWYHSDGNRKVGKIEGAIWECGIVGSFADDYDKILSGTVDDPELYAFLKSRAEKYELPAKGTRELFLANVDEGLLRTAYKGVLAGRIQGNEGMHQRAVAACALALNTQPETNQWLDWLFKPTGGAVPGLMLDVLDRDGVSNEAAPGYALFWGQILSGIGEELAAYPAYTAHNIFKDFPQFRAAYVAPWRMCALGRATPNIGDTGACGLVARVGLNASLIATGYRYTHDPELAIAAYRANGNSSTGLGRDVFSQDPDGLAKEIDAAAKAAGPRSTGSSLMTGFNLATLESPAGDHGGTAIAMSYGRTSHHAHPDQLNFDLMAFGNWLAPDHGYPEFATNWPSRNEWTNTTLSHNLVLVDGKPQTVNWGGRVNWFKALPGLSAVQVAAPAAYPGAHEYSRTLALVDTPDGKNAYAIDVFRVTGGKDHLLSFHGPPGTQDVEGVMLADQGGGTYAGKDVAVGTRAGNKFPIGFSYLYDVRRSAGPAAAFAVDFKAAAGYRSVSKSDDLHLKWYSATPCQDVATAHGDPPQNKPGNPRRLPYVLVHRSGEDGLSSTFVSVLEPYRGTGFVKKVDRVDATGGAAVRVELTDGTTDYFDLRSTGQEVKVENGPELAGAMGFVRTDADGKVTNAALVGGTRLSMKDVQLTGSGVLIAKVAKMNRELGGGGFLWVDEKWPTDGSLVGQYVQVAPSSERDACYRIESVERDGALTKVYCGPITFVRGYAGPRVRVRGQALAGNYSKGYLYDFEIGAEARVVTHNVYRPK